MLSTYGKFVRKLRIDKGVTLGQMAKDLEKSSAFLSAIETGKKDAPATLIQQVAQYFGLDHDNRSRLEAAALESRSQISLGMQGFNKSQREVAAAFCRQFSSMPPEKLDQLKSLLGTKD